MPATLAQLNEALKTIYRDPIIKAIDEGSGPVFAAIEKNSNKIVGNDIKFALQYGRNGGIGARAEDGALPEASPRKYLQATTGTKNIFGRINFTEKLMLVTQSNKAAFVDAVSTQMEDLTNDAKDMMRRNIMQKSNGIMATVKEAVTSNTSVKIAGNIKMFYTGQKIDIFTVSGTTQTMATGGTGAVIVDVNYDADTIVLAANVTASQGAYIGLAGNYNNELTGIGDVMTANSIIYGVDRSRNKWFNPRIYDKSTGSGMSAFSSSFFQEAIDDIDDFSGLEPDFICCDSAMRRAYKAEQDAYKRNTEFKTVDGGYRVMTYNDIAISKEKYIDPNTIYILNSKDWELQQLADWGWLDADGSILTRVADKAAYEATLTKYCDLICKRPFAQAKIINVSA